MKNRYRRAVLEALKSCDTKNPGIIGKEDMEHLPPVVRRYIEITGFAGRERVKNFRAEFKGGIRSKPSDEFMKLHSVQYNFIDEDPSRIFYISARKMGIPAAGLHLYLRRTAIMVIRVLGLFKVVDAKGPEMNQGETVTLFNDMCFMAPGTLIDRRITWEKVDDLTVNATFTNGEIRISATLYFNGKGELINFMSNDRYETVDGRSYRNLPWITPVSAYGEFNGYHLPSEAELIYRHPSEDFCYGRFSLQSMDYNLTRYR